MKIVFEVTSKEGVRFSGHLRPAILRVLIGLWTVPCFIQIAHAMGWM